MISLLSGKVVSIIGRNITLDVQGVGYEVKCPSSVVSNLQVGEALTMHIYTAVSQENISLYGFKNIIEKQVFLLLIQVQGIGCKSAAEIVSNIDARNLLKAIGQESYETLQMVKGIGKKTAQRLVLELKDKVAEFVDLNSEGQKSSQFLGDKLINQVVGQDFNVISKDAISALKALGFGDKEAKDSVKAVVDKMIIKNGTLNDCKQSISAGEIVKLALKYI